MTLIGVNVLYINTAQCLRVKLTTGELALECGVKLKYICTLTQRFGGITVCQRAKSQ